MPNHQIAGELVEHLGPTLVATLANVRDSKLPYKWAKESGPRPHDESLTRMQAALRIWRMIASAENEHVARVWFIGANPHLGEATPVAALREGQITEVMGAATVFCEG